MMFSQAIAVHSNKIIISYKEPQMQEATYPLVNSLIIAVVVFGVIVVYSMDLKSKFEKRISALRSRTPQQISTHKVIIAFEPNQLFFKLATTSLPGWRQVILRDVDETSLWGGLTKMFKKKMYYRLNYQKSEIINFIQSLSLNTKIQLYLYTSVSLQVVEFVLKQIGILKHFPEQFRVCTHKNKMHAVEVDSQTNRVLIFTGSKKDYEEEYNKYFLVLRKKAEHLLKVGRKVNKLVNMNEDIDQLHNELSLLKIKVESESEECTQTC